MLACTVTIRYIKYEYSIEAILLHSTGPVTAETGQSLFTIAVTKFYHDYGVHDTMPYQT